MVMPLKCNDIRDRKWTLIWYSHQRPYLNVNLFAVLLFLLLRVFFLALCLCPFFLLGERELSKRESDGAMEKWVKRWNKISIENLCLWHWCWSFIFDVVWCGLLVVVIFRFDSLTHSNFFLSLAFVLSICFAVFLLLLFHSLTFNASFGSIAMVAATKIDELFVFSALMLFSMSIF